jgi:hypothetical protein
MEMEKPLRNIQPEDNVVGHSGGWPKEQTGQEGQRRDDNQLLC